METLQSLWQLVRSASIADVVDILIVAYVLYRGIKMMRNTNAEKLIKGLLFLLVAMQLAEWFHLNVIHYVLGNVMTIGFLALVVIFQPELRRMLEQMGRSSFTSLFEKAAPVTAQSNAIIQTVEACSELSDTRTGALIVFERREKLNDISRTGTRVNADVTAELIKNIFYPKAPLHDGAMSVVDSRIHAAGCVLPLSASQRLSRELGTRHRAAVGMSETADCVCVVVSEETGSISVAVGGMLKRHLAPEMLQRVLEAELMPAREEETGKKNKLSLRKERNK